MNYKAIILRKMFRRRIIGGKHTAVEHLIQGIPKHCAKEAKCAVKKLIKEGIICVKLTNYGMQVSLNPKQIDKIIKIVEGNLK